VLIFRYLQNFSPRPGWLIYLFYFNFISMNSKNLFYRKVLKSFRASLRNRTYSAEVVLWQMLKSIKLDGRKFSRQYSIGSYIVGFFCPPESTTPAADSLCNSITTYILRSPLLEKEGKCYSRFLKLTVLA
jgi:hypothetical protein